MRPHTKRFQCGGLSAAGSRKLHRDVRLISDSMHLWVTISPQLVQFLMEYVQLVTAYSVRWSKELLFVTFYLVLFTAFALSWLWC